VTVTGKLAPESIQTRMNAHMPAFAACQKESMAEGTPVTGTLRLRILIDQTGQVSGANVTAPSTLKNDKLARCVLKVVRSTAFARPAQGTVEATYSVVFESSR
jgi:TonB family protein